jgi:hypothetical protein
MTAARPFPRATLGRPGQAFVFAFASPARADCNLPDVADRTKGLPPTTRCPAISAVGAPAQTGRPARATGIRRQTGYEPLGVLAVKQRLRIDRGAEVAMQRSGFTSSRADTPESAS